MYHNHRTTHFTLNTFSRLALAILLTALLSGWQATSAVRASASPPTGETQQVEPGQTPEGLSAAEWGSIQDQIAAGKYLAYAADNGGYVASNPAHGWQIAYGADGRTALTPRLSSPTQGADWDWGLQLTGYGYEDLRGLQDLGGLVLQADQDTLTYRWDANLSEWWINTSAGLEQGFTLLERPHASRFTPHAPLVLEMAVTGDLTPVLRGDAVAFVDAAGATAFTYAKLRVTDAEGKVIPARLELATEYALRTTQYTLRILVNDDAAAYPLTIDPLLQQAYLKASNTGASDYFGLAVAISGDTLVVGAYAEASNATGVDGNQADNSASYAGAAYVFTRSGATWSQQAYLKASNTDAWDYFGLAVAISGDTLVVGAYQEDSNATGVDGNQADNSASYAGAVYVFTRSGATWSQQAYLKASNTEASDYFGYTVAVDGDTVVVGAYQEDSNATGVNGNQADNSAGEAGAAYVFTRSGAAWSQQAYLKASNTGASDYFGCVVAVSGDTVVVGAAYEDSNATGVGGDENNNSAGGAGAAYVFTRIAGVWSQQAYLKASNTEASDYFGRAVAVSSDTVVVGAYGEDSNATGVDGNQADNSASGAGVVYVFTRSGGVWSQQAYLKASNTEAFDYFGRAVAVSGDTLVVGAYQEASNATGVDGNQGDNSASGAGAAYVFTCSGATWSQQAYLKASNTGANDRFGCAVAVSGDTLVVGAYYEDSNATGVDGNQADNSSSEAGAAYVFNSCIRSAQSGSWGATATWENATVPGSSDGVCIQSGHTVSLGAAAASDTLWVRSGGTLDLSTWGFTVENGVWNYGTMQQTQNVPASSTINFLQIQPNGGGPDQYRGLDITTDGSTNLGSTTVRVMGQTAVCNNSDGGAYRDRCFMANPANSGSAAVTLYSTVNEDDLSDDAFFQYASGTTWTQGATCADAVGGGGACTSAATFTSPAWFLIGSQTSNPTAITLRGFAAHTGAHVPVALSLGLLGLVGSSLALALRRRSGPAGRARRS